MSAGFIKPDQLVESVFVSLPPAPEKGKNARKGGKKAKKWRSRRSQRPHGQTQAATV